MIQGYSQTVDSYKVVSEIIENLPDDALNELLGGYSWDIDKLFLSTIEEVDNILNEGRASIDLSSIEYLPKFQKTFDDTLKILSYNYFKATTLTNFDMGWRNIEWGNMVQLYPWSSFRCSRGSGKSYEFCFAFPLWRLFRYRKPRIFQQDRLDNKNSRETVIITNESKLARLHLSKIVQEIRSNDLLHDVLLPDKLPDLGKDQIRTKNGAVVHLRSKDSAIRGLHVGGVVVDDFLDKSCIYSSEQRDKFKEVFYAEILSIVEPGGYLLVSGTPFFFTDLYYDIENDKRFRSFVYPGIYPDGSILAPERHTFKYLMDMKESMGSLIFSREVLCVPVSDSSTIFPWEFLERSYIGMDKVKLVDNIESYPIKMEKVVVGCDFAISGGIGADYSVFSVWGRGVDKKYYLIYVWRAKGASHNEQISRMLFIDSAFKPNKFICENNNFQRILSALARERGLTNIEEFTTGSNKKDLYEGLPSISALFERGEIKLPYGDEKSCNNAQWLCGEFNSVTFNQDSGKLESATEHDDGAMSTYFAIQDLRESGGVFKISYI